MKWLTLCVILVTPTVHCFYGEFIEFVEDLPLQYQPGECHFHSNGYYRPGQLGIRVVLDKQVLDFYALGYLKYGTEYKGFLQNLINIKHVHPGNNIIRYAASYFGRRYLHVWCIATPFYSHPNTTPVPTTSTKPTTKFTTSTTTPVTTTSKSITTKSTTTSAITKPTTTTTTTKPTTATTATTTQPTTTTTEPTTTSTTKEPTTTTTESTTTTTTTTTERTTTTTTTETDLYDNYCRADKPEL
ncbi:unnamed protein product [Mytilus edulis]|uniref:Uncharacterized protein n=1 Tax=Mytilus edulis TaxID=6550 RepID=A0A8S3TCG2_MYTED|nr:unnamed protein product [Mytilus edulis]